MKFVLVFFKRGFKKFCIMYDICIMYNKCWEFDFEEKRWKSCCIFNNFVCIDIVVLSFVIIINLCFG